RCPRIGQGPNARRNAPSSDHAPGRRNVRQALDDQPLSSHRPVARHLYSMVAGGTVRGSDRRGCIEVSHERLMDRLTKSEHAASAEYNPEGGTFAFAHRRFIPPSRWRLELRPEAFLLRLNGPPKPPGLLDVSLEGRD